MGGSLPSQCFDLCLQPAQGSCLKKTRLSVTDPEISFPGILPGPRQDKFWILVGVSTASGQTPRQPVKLWRGLHGAWAPSPQPQKILLRFQPRQVRGRGCPMPHTPEQVAKVVFFRCTRKPPGTAAE